MAQIAKTHEEYVIELMDKKIRVFPLEPYTRARDKIKHKCICGEAWLVTPHNVLHGRLCGCTRKVTKMKSHQKLYKDKLKEKNIKVIPLEPYKGYEVDSLHKCVCGNEWLITPSEVLRGYQCGCGKLLSQAITHEEYLERLKEGNIKVKPLEKYISMTKKILHQCVCGTKWRIHPGNVLSGRKCGCVPSHGEEIIKEYLDLNKIDYEQQVIFDGLKSIHNRSLKYDFVIKKDNEIIFLIEFQGLPHYEFIPLFHSDFIGFLELQDRDQRKRDFAKKNNIPLIEVPYWENTIEYLRKEVDQNGIKSIEDLF